MLIDCLGWCFFGYISLLHVILYKKNLLYVLIMAVSMVTLFAALLYYQSIRIAKFRHEQDATTPLEQPSVEEEENTSEHNEDAEAEMEVRITVHEERPAAAAEVDTRALDIIQHMRDMVNAHVRKVGEMSDSDDEEKETPRYRLAEVLHRPGMIEKLFDLGWGLCPDTSVSLGGDFTTGGHDGGAAGSE
jgi:membrane-associated HD superfamily phosphohydrolase